MRRRLLLAAGLAALTLLLPGWGARLAVVPHAGVLAAARTAPPDLVFGVALPAEDGGSWHAQYHRSLLARTLREVGLGAAVTMLVPPDFAAHVPAGAERADGYFRVRTEWRWPWWWPGGGVDWRDPRVASPGRR